MQENPLDKLLQVKPLEGRLKSIINAINTISKAVERNKQAGIDFKVEIDINEPIEQRNERIATIFSMSEDFINELVASATTIKVDSLLARSALANIQQLKTYVPSVLQEVDVAGTSLLDGYVKNKNVTHIGLAVTFNTYQRCKDKACDCQKTHLIFTTRLMLLSTKDLSEEHTGKFSIKSMIFTSEQEL